MRALRSTRTSQQPISTKNTTIAWDRFMPARAIATRHDSKQVTRNPAHTAHWNIRMCSDMDEGVTRA